jgi:type IV pilus assembly protein PilV
MKHANNSQRRRARPARPRQLRGIALIEAMVSILIFLIGILGVIGLHSAMMRAQGAAKFRADAAVLASEVVGSMWGDAGNLAGYASSANTPCTLAPCARWLAKVANALPHGAAAIETSAQTGIATINVSWTLPTDGAHLYVTTTDIH